MWLRDNLVKILWFILFIIIIAFLPTIVLKIKIAVESFDMCLSAIHDTSLPWETIRNAIKFCSEEGFNLMNGK